MQTEVRNQINEPTWLTLEQAAVYLQTSIRTIKQLIADNKLTSYKPEGTYMRRFKRADLDAFITSGLSLSESDAIAKAKGGRK